ncbi:MAG: neutral/alkaline non-lysosomal ceramidase N-terminal domain-containing protein [Verrucomicrobia bacterium]|nr:neutral/alkaline non-lysosomal ceramidase N-terminal domain-containing protein [Verrucomicrobiota bacterium]
MRSPPWPRAPRGNDKLPAARREIGARPSGRSACDHRSALSQTENPLSRGRLCGLKAALLGLLSAICGLLRCGTAFAADQEAARQIGVARIDITPAYPIRLTGYAVRKTESEGTAQKLWAKALAIGSDQEGPAVFVTVDNCGVGANVIEEVAERLKRKASLARERFAVCSSHTHSGPCTVGFAPNIFAQKIPDDQLATIVRYTKELTDKLEQVALAALADRKPGKLAWGEGRVGFAANRRTAGGPADHALPVLAAYSRDGKLRAVIANYACHCTTLGGEFNQFCGDWAGFAQAAIERDHPGAVALISIGCGADANPSPRGGPDFGLALAKRHGEELAREVSDLLAGHLLPLRHQPACRAKRIELPYDKHFTREELQERAKQTGIVGYHAQDYLNRLDRGEKLPPTLPYFVQTWTFGDQLAIVFLGGEVVVDYSLRLKKEFDGARLWITGYANDVPCYIPSRRILQEGGYEAESSLWYYGRPAKLAPAIEDLIVNTVHELLPKEFLADPKKAEFPPPKSPEESLTSIRTKPGLTIELVAAEPLVVDPVEIDWGADGKLWVVEMRDFPLGMDGKWKPGGRVKLLADTDGDGGYDQASVFLDDLPFPTGITAWSKGVLVCAAPDIIYAEDTNGDGKADVVKKLFSGFATENYQARVNSLHLGLDNWIYGANGLIGGVIRGSVGGKEISISGRDFRFRPETGEFEPAAGLTQQGRVRDDFDNWFGCDNSTLLWHYPLPDHYVRRNPHFTPPEPRVNVAAAADPNRLFPISRTLNRFNDPHHVNRVTSACGLGLYRDDLLGEDFSDNAFVCEPVHNLVHRLVLKPDGVTFKGRRAPDEQQREFLASRDNWFRPVQVRTGPDGALWVVDFYRFVVEHPRWITPERLAELDLRAGEDKGRLYRVYPRGEKLRPVRDLTKLPSAELAAALDTPNGTERDRVHLELLRRAAAAAAPLIRLVRASALPAVRVQALSALDGLRALPADVLEAALNDAHPAARRHAIRFSENVSSPTPRLNAALLQRLSDADASVRFQLALSLGRWDDPRAGEALGRLAVAGLDDPWLRAAVLSSATRCAGEILEAVLAAVPDSPARSDFIGQLIATAAGSADRALLSRALSGVVPPTGLKPELWRFQAITSLLDALARQGVALDSLADASDADLRGAIGRLREMFASAQRVATDDTASEALCEAAVRLLGRQISQTGADLEFLARLLGPPTAQRLQSVALESLSRSQSALVPALLLADWSRHSPALRAGIVQTLLTRDEWAARLLTAIEEQTVALPEVSAANRQRLLKRKNAALQQRAAAIFASAQSSDRASVLEQFKSATTLPGDEARGAAHFGKLCASCHAFRGQGLAVGPNLAALTDKSPQFLLTSILDPNAAVANPFAAYNLETCDGRSLSGVVVAETGTSLTLAIASGVRETILRTDIVELRASNLSLMPEGLEQGLAPQDLADLIAYLQHSPAPFGGATAEQAARSRRQFFDGGAGALARVLPGAEQLPYGSWLGRQSLHYCRQTDGKSKLAWQTAPVPANLKPDSFQKFRLPVAMGLLSQPTGSFQLLLNGSAVLSFDVALFDQAWQSDDAKVRLSYTVMENNTEDSNGVLEIEVSGALLEPGRAATFEVRGSASNSQRWFGVFTVAQGQ